MNILDKNPPLTHTQSCGLFPLIPATHSTHSHCLLIYCTYKHILSYLCSRREVCWGDLVVEAHSCVVLCTYPYTINPTPRKSGCLTCTSPLQSCGLLSLSFASKTIWHKSLSSASFVRPKSSHRQTLITYGQRGSNTS